MYKCFLCGCTDTNDAERSGRPNEAKPPENVKEVLKILIDNSKVEVLEIT